MGPWPLVALRGNKEGRGDNVCFSGKLTRLPLPCSFTLHHNNAQYTRTDLNSESYVLRVCVFQIHVRSQSCIHTSHLPLTPFVRNDFSLRSTKCVCKCTRILCQGLQLMLTNGHNHRFDQSEIKITDNVQENMYQVLSSFLTRVPSLLHSNHHSALISTQNISLFTNM